METGAITEYIDVAQLVLYAFWVFFAGLIFYLRREDKREGYPLESERSANIRVQGFPAMPRPKRFVLAHGGEYFAPNESADTRSLNLRPAAPFPGAPSVPTGDPMVDGVGPASWAERDDEPDLTLEGEPRIVPIRVATQFFVEPHDPDPRGMSVVGADGLTAGTVKELWVDRSEPQVRYLEVEVEGPEGTRTALLPITLARVERARQRVKVASIRADQFAQVPALRDPNQITRLEEDKVCAFYGGGHLYALPSRQESLL